MAQNSRRGHMDKAISRYSSLFTLPTYKDVTILLCILCIITGVLTVLPFDISSYGLSVGLSLGASLFFVSLLGDYLIANILLKEDPILDSRRCSFLSFSSNLILFVFSFIATLASASFSDPNLWSKITSLGVFAALSLRLLVFYSVSFVSSWKIFSSALLQPALLLVLLSVIPRSSFGLQDSSLPYFSLAVFAAFFGVYLFIASLNGLGTKELGIQPIKMFKAFLVNWTEDLEKPLEEILEQLSEENEVKLSLLAFKAGKKLKAMMVVPNIHPGPFKNVGSSSIPSLIQNALEKKLECVVSVPHGISGHELDLASQAQNEKVLNRILEASEFDVFHPYATQFLNLKEGDATVGCQIFGDCALLTLTLAPKTMEDLPLELNDIIVHEAKERGLAWAVAVDAHNSIQGPFDPEKAILLEKAVATVLQKATCFERLPFEVGAAKVVPEEFGIREGMGPGGISVIVTKVGNQETAYVTIDGNNMVPNLREKILSSLQELGVNGGEILTTDTHIVNGVVMADRGYYPVGEMIDHDRLIGYVRTAVTEALRNLEPAERSWRHEGIPGVRVIGERQINSLCLLVDRGAKRAKKSSTLIFPSLGILLAVLLIFL